jgi:hypothetical protein
MNRFSFRIGAVIIMAACALTTAYAQFSGSLSGSVEDPTGRVIPGATITLINTSTGEQKTSTSASDGSYQFVSLAPGSYQLKTSSKGFA